MCFFSKCREHTLFKITNRKQGPKWALLDLFWHFLALFGHFPFINWSKKLKKNKKNVKKHDFQPLSKKIKKKRVFFPNPLHFPFLFENRVQIWPFLAKKGPFWPLFSIKLIKNVKKKWKKKSKNVPKSQNVVQNGPFWVPFWALFETLLGPFWANYTIQS